MGLADNAIEAIDAPAAPEPEQQPAAAPEPKPQVAPEPTDPPTAEPPEPDEPGTPPGPAEPPAGDEPSPAAPAQEPGDDTQITMKDGSKRTIAELKSGNMMQSEFTRKTKGHAAAVRELEGREAAVKEAGENITKYWQALKADPEYMRDQLETWAPDAFLKAVYAMGAELDAENQMDEPSRRLAQENRMYRRQQRIDAITEQRRQADEKTRQEQADREKMTAKQKELATKYNGWLVAGMKKAGLVAEKDEKHNAYMWRQVKREIIDTHGQGAEYTEAQILQAAKDVAESPAIMAYMRERGATHSPEELLEAIGPEAAAKLRAYEVEKLKKSKEPPKPTAAAKPAKPVKKTPPKPKTPSEFFGKFHEDD